ncbi:3-deoxy-7-phosphoheptulonate synthase [Ornithinimicrobium faecis]|uniref:Phospho-2-dehydro-3-deoxyheptonate aldolase n=1 Tax=Ornithinimicrobium faecis TaxID=2934158 RepID=A0ABY4YNW0_9MICO|nr:MULTISPECIES: 3-deoxy-7-phosphoheptulonate synthase [unclassified Ornithinimicrobium]USQ78180.1 3-deoxy-7-phosphoheptulonate synthase [Ornithinimicrobium sp. HY1793]
MSVTPSATTRRTSTNDLRVRRMEPLPTPTQVLSEQPLPDELATLVDSSRGQIQSVLRGDDDRLLVVVGPCSVHDPGAAIDYARRLKTLADDLADDLVVVMRVYFEKPRTTTGWKGLINDPDLDGSYDIPRGLRLARQVLLGVLETGLPAGCEYLETTTPQYIADTVSYGAIGARTVESQVHRQLVSGLSMPVGLKNGSDGSVQVAVDACVASAAPQTFLGVDEEGRAALVETDGNPDGHVILRGGRNEPNSDAASVAAARALLERAGLEPRLVIDASHGNSRKDHVRQAEVAREIGAQVAGGDDTIVGVMLESFLVAGKQEPAPSGLTYGQSVTDACMAWETTTEVLSDLATSVRERRNRRTA